MAAAIVAGRGEGGARTPGTTLAIPHDSGTTLTDLIVPYSRTPSESRTPVLPGGHDIAPSPDAPSARLPHPTLGMISQFSWHPFCHHVGGRGCQDNSSPANLIPPRVTLSCLHVSLTLSCLHVVLSRAAPPELPFTLLGSLGCNVSQEHSSRVNLQVARCLNGYSVLCHAHVHRD
jgi:hypothetical protein